MKNIIEIKDLTKFYGNNRGINNLSLNIKEGEIFGFVGPNGSGKSTTIRCLLALIFPTSGSATIFNKDCIKEASTIANSIGYLPSEVFYYDNMKVKELLDYSASFYDHDCSKRCDELCKKLNLDVTRKIEELSFGNRKKVGIVQALLHSPKLIILDEPTGGLDPLMQQTFFNILREENKKGTTIIFSSHILSEVQKLCDRVGIIKEGEIIKIDEVSNITNSTYKHVELVSNDTKAKDILKDSCITNLIIDNSNIQFSFNGNTNDLIKLLSNLNIKDLTLREPELEEIFMHYYE
ncbi:MAG: ABC transporter ATP-binding protein [Erysipelotrichaceae bacterium]